MSLIKLVKFGGMFPRVPRSLLPDAAAQTASNCDLAYGELRSMRAPFLLKSLAGPIASLYTEDGIRFFTWPTDVDAVRGPVIDDTYQRIYYTSGSDFRVTTNPNMTSGGGQPTQSYRVGVPRPTVAPVLTADAGAALPANLAITGDFFYEYNGVKYQEGPITLEEVEKNKTYRITPPAKTGGSGGTAGTSSGIKITSVGDFLIGGGSSESGGTATPNPDGVYTPTQSFGAFVANVIAHDTIRVADPLSSGLTTGRTFTCTAVMGADGQPHDVATLFSMTRYSTVNDVAGTSGTASTGATPDQAFPAIRIDGTNGDTGESVFSGYSDNSSFVDKGSKVKVSLVADDANPGKYLVKLDLGGNTASADEETRAYVYTLVNTYNEEGAPSPPAVVTVNILTRVNVGATLPASDQYAPIKSIRVYRSVTGTDSDNYFFVTELPCLASPPGVYTIADDIRAGGLGEMLRSIYWLPPDPTLRGLCNIGNGILMAWKGNETWFSEAFRPHAWSPNNVLTYPHNIVAGATHGAGAVIVTTAEPHLISGVSPDSMSEIALPVDQSCVAKGAITTVGGATVFASHDGLVVVQGGQVSLDLGQRFFTRQVWRDMYGKNLGALKLASYDGAIIAYFTDGSASPFMIRLDEASGSLTNLYVSAPIVAHTYLPTTDGLYVAQGNNLYEWGGSSAQMSMLWSSKEFVVAAPTNFGAGYAVVEDGTNVLIGFYADGALRHIQSVTSTRYFRLPDGYKAQRWSILVMGIGVLRELYLAGVMRELATA